MRECACAARRFRASACEPTTNVEYPRWRQDRAPRLRRCMGNRQLLGPDKFPDLATCVRGRPPGPPAAACHRPCHPRTACMPGSVSEAGAQHHMLCYPLLPAQTAAAHHGPRPLLIAFASGLQRKKKSRSGGHDMRSLISERHDSSSGSEGEAVSS